MLRLICSTSIPACSLGTNKDVHTTMKRSTSIPACSLGANKDVCTTKHTLASLRCKSSPSISNMEINHENNRLN